MEAQQARRWSTAGAGTGQGLSYWIEAICEAFLEMKADSAAGRAFAGSCLLYTSPSPRDKRQSRMPSSA